MNQPMDHPKILFVNQAPPDSLALADLVRQLLVGYPPERIAWWYCRTPRSRGLTDLKVGSLHRYPLPVRLVPNRKLRALKGGLLEWIWAPLAARHLRKTVLEVKPDLVWVLLYEWPILVAHRMKLPPGPRLHVSLWDCPDTEWQVQNLGAARSQRFVNAAFELTGRATTCDGVSRGMLEEIRSRTGRRDAVLVHSGFEPQHLKLLEAAAPVSGDSTLRLAYVGSIITEQSFLRTLMALDKVRASIGRPVVLEFFGGRNYASRPWFDPQWMMEHGVFSDQGLVESLRRCDWGIVVTDLEGQSLRYSRFSFPNKIGTYLSAGVPVLGLGHATSALADVMRSNRIGTFSSAEGGAAMEEFLSRSLKLPQPRAHYREDILSCARTEFNAMEIRERLWRAWGVKPGRPKA